MEDIINIKKDYYPSPVQVRFCQRLEYGSFTEDGWGIAFQDHIICLGCGQLIDLNDYDTIVWEQIDEWVSCDEELFCAAE